MDSAGRTLFEFGEPDRAIFYRSAVKPIQAMVAIRSGVQFAPEEVAITCSSHSGYPIHIAYVRKILANAGLTEASLQTPPDWPLGKQAALAVRVAGHKTKRRIWHNCSGKHAGWLATSRHQGWDETKYLAPTHPLQRQIIDLVHETTKFDPNPTGIDGCGAPTLRGSARGLANAFARISSDPEFVATAGPVHRFPGLVGGNDREDGRLGAWWDGPMKGGAEGLLGGGRHGIGIAVRSEDGSSRIAVLGFIAVARKLGLLSDAAFDALRSDASPTVFGGGLPVGNIEPQLTS